MVTEAVEAAVVDSPIGPLRLVATDAGLAGLSFGAGRVRAPEPVAGGLLAEVAGQLREYFGERRKDFELPLDWSRTQGFARTVLHKLYTDVPFGETVGYQELARTCGRPNAARVVGAIMGSNPIALIVPCHRVIAADGTLGGFGGGLEMKRRLLVLEGVLQPTLLD